MAEKKKAEATPEGGDKSKNGKIKKAIEVHREELTRCGVTLTDEQLNVLIEVVKASL